MSTPQSHLHDMYRLLQECGEDTDCGCGCSGHDEPKGKKKALVEKPKKKAESIGEEVDAILDEMRRKLGLKRFRNIKRVAEVKRGGASKVMAVRKTKHAVRSGAAHNRHR